MVFNGALNHQTMLLNNSGSQITFTPVVSKMYVAINVGQLEV